MTVYQITLSGFDEISSLVADMLTINTYNITTETIKPLSYIIPVTNISG